MQVYEVRHSTLYRYSAPAQLGPQRLVLRPRDSHDLRIRETGLAITPEPAAVTWLHDVYGNSIATATFAGETQELRIESRLKVAHYGLPGPEFPLEPFAETWPFNYRPQEWPDLKLYIERQFSDPDGVLDRWVRRFSSPGQAAIDTHDLLLGVMRAIKAELPYRVREEEGIQPPLQTLAQGGSCRDFAVLLIEAVRTMGIAARFVSGYLYVPAADEGGPGLIGGGATHAWAEIYLPGAGWVQFDPTNALVGGQDLIRVAIARDPRAVSPIAGSFSGHAGTTSEITVEVDVRRVEVLDAQ